MSRNAGRALSCQRLRESGSAMSPTCGSQASFTGRSSPAVSRAPSALPSRSAKPGCCGAGPTARSTSYVHGSALPPSSPLPAAALVISSSASAPSTASSTVTRFGVDPLEILKMGIPLAKITPLEELFGGSIYDHTPASSAHKDTTSEADPVKALEESQNTQDFSSGGDVHALLQLLRS